MIPTHDPWFRDLSIWAVTSVNLYYVNFVLADKWFLFVHFSEHCCNTFPKTINRILSYMCRFNTKPQQIMYDISLLIFRHPNSKFNLLKDWIEKNIEKMAISKV